MSSVEESPAQQAARLRRERREAKIKAGGSARLDKITSLSGRPSAIADPDASPTPSPQPRPQAESTQSPFIPTQTQPQFQPQFQPQTQPLTQPQTQTSQAPPPSSTPSNLESSPDSIQAQQEYLRALLRANPSEQQAQQHIDQDPMMKVLSSMLGGLPGAENTAPGSGMAPPAQGDLRANDMASALGIPPLFTKMFLGEGSAPQSPEDQSWESLLKLLHTLLALFVGVYLVILVNSAVGTYGGNPPPPATAQNPFAILITVELLLSGARMFLGRNRPGSLATGVQLFKNIVRDGSIAVFALGVASWWNGGWQISASS